MTSLISLVKNLVSLGFWILIFNALKFSYYIVMDIEYAWKNCPAQFRLLTRFCSARSSSRRGENGVMGVRKGRIVI